MKALGILINDTEKVMKSSVMGISTWETMTMEESMGKEFTPG